MPEATPTHVIEALLTLAVLQPTIGCRQYADRLGDQGFSIAKSTVQKHLVAHGLGKRAQRLAKAAAIAAATTGLVVPDAERKDEPFGFCLASGGPGELVCLDSFYIGKLKGVGKVYQLTAIDVFTRFAVTSIVLGTPNRRHDGPLHPPGPASLSPSRGAGPGDLDGQWRRIHGRHLRRGPGGQGTASRPHPGPLPNHNAVCERFQGTMLQECWRPAFHRRHFTSIRQLQAEADAWLITYNHRRRNHSDYMRGRTPHEILDNHKRNKAA